MSTPFIRVINDVTILFTVNIKQRESNHNPSSEKLKTPLYFIKGRIGARNNKAGAREENSSHNSAHNFIE
jgi:hypothetical protein